MKSEGRISQRLQQISATIPWELANFGMGYTVIIVRIRGTVDGKNLAPATMPEKVLILVKKPFGAP